MPLPFKKVGRSSSEQDNVHDAFNRIIDLISNICKVNYVIKNLVNNAMLIECNNIAVLNKFI